MMYACNEEFCVFSNTIQKCSYNPWYENNMWMQSVELKQPEYQSMCRFRSKFNLKINVTLEYFGVPVRNQVE